LNQTGINGVPSIDYDERTHYWISVEGQFEHTTDSLHSATSLASTSDAEQGSVTLGNLEHFM
jgi:hypothetical protein